jgi:predicted anti-sigma-YlaC factor YlaD
VVGADTARKSAAIGNQRPSVGDHHRMECARIREALSARLDGEAADIRDEVVDRHVGGCRACTAWATEVAALHRMVRVREAEAVPDLSAAIVDGFVPAPARRGVGAAGRQVLLGEPISGSRWGLFVVALTQLVLAGPALVLGQDSGATIHVAHEIGSFDVALAVGLLVAAWQPARAWGLLPLAAALVLVMSASSVLDVVHGRVTALGETHHLLAVAGVVFLWRVAHELRPAGPRGRALAA